MLAFGPERLVVSVVVVVLVVVQPASINKPAQARHMIAFFISPLYQKRAAAPSFSGNSYPRFATSSTFFQSSAES